MARALVTTARFSSMLGNRGLDVQRLRERNATTVDLDRLSREDLELEFEEIVSLAKLFNKPWPYLLIDAEEPKRKNRGDNRTLLNQQRGLSPELVDQYAAAEAMLRAGKELFPDIRYASPTHPIAMDTDVVEAARVLRDLLGVTYDDQLTAKSPYDAMHLWGAALQERGVYVSTRRLDDLSVRAFSIVDGPQAVVVADSQDIPYARLFSYLHEYVHIALHSSGLCDLSEQSVIERYCNAVAAAMLMPSDLMARVLPKRTWGRSLDEDEVVVAEVSAILGVSKASFLIRLRDLSVLSQSTYEQLEVRRAKRRGADEKKSTGGSYHRNAINKVGRRFARRVVGAYEDGRIDREDASVLLEIPEHNFPAFRRELAKAGGVK